MKIRIKFAKQGAMKFVGHLDIMRYFQKAMRRAEIDIQYSEGFSPHQKMSFAAPLGVGLISRGEYFDIEVYTTVNSKEAVRRLNEVMVEDMEVLSYLLLPDDAKNAMSLVGAADYRVRFREACLPEDVLAEKWAAFIGRDSIEVVKTTKKGESLTEIRPLIMEGKIVSTEGFVSQEAVSAADAMSENDNVSSGSEFFLKLVTGSENNLKPELVMQAFTAYAGIELPPFGLLTERLELYGKTETGELIPLEAFGTEIM